MWARVPRTSYHYYDHRSYEDEMHRLCSRTGRLAVTGAFGDEADTFDAPPEIEDRLVLPAGHGGELGFPRAPPAAAKAQRKRPATGPSLVEQILARTRGADDELPFEEGSADATEGTVVSVPVIASKRTHASRAEQRATKGVKAVLDELLSDKETRDRILNFILEDPAYNQPHTRVKLTALAGSVVAECAIQAGAEGRLESEVSLAQRKSFVSDLLKLRAADAEYQTGPLSVYLGGTFVDPQDPSGARTDHWVLNSIAPVVLIRKFFMSFKSVQLQLWAVILAQFKQYVQGLGYPLDTELKDVQWFNEFKKFLPNPLLPPTPTPFLLNPNATGSNKSLQLRTFVYGPSELVFEYARRAATGQALAAATRAEDAAAAQQLQDTYFPRPHSTGAPYNAIMRARAPPSYFYGPRY